MEGIPKPSAARSTAVLILDWDGIRPSVSLGSMRRATFLRDSAAISDKEHAAIQEWFAPWATETKNPWGADKWWDMVFSTRKPLLLLPVIPGLKDIVTRLFNSYSTNPNDWDVLTTKYIHYNKTDGDHSLMKLSQALALFCRNVERKSPAAVLLEKLLADCCAATTRTQLTITTLWLVGLPLSRPSWQLILDLQVFRLNRDGQKDVFKAITTAVQRTSMMAKGNREGYIMLDSDQMASCCYIQEALGRSGWKCDWKKEKEERCDPDCYIPLFYPDAIGNWTEAAYADVEADIFIDIVREVTVKSVVKTSHREHYSMRQEWSSSGSAGPMSVKTPVHSAPMPILSVKEGWRNGHLVLGPDLGSDAGTADHKACISFPNGRPTPGWALNWPKSGGATLVISDRPEGAHFYRNPLTCVDASTMKKDWNKHVESMKMWRRAPITKRHRVGKRGAIEMYDYDEMMEKAFVSYCNATACTKDERGTARAIYAVEFFHFLRSSWVYGTLENMVSSLPELCGQLSTNEVAWLEAALTDTHDIFYAADHTNFNLIHSLIRQANLLLAFRDIPCATPEIKEDWTREIEWLAATMLNQHVTWPDGTVDKVVQGLFSGLRGTSFNNDVLHVAYVRAALRLAVRILDVNKLYSACVIRGDDVLMGMKSWLYSAVLHACLVAMGFKLNPAKQIFSRLYGVFLRMIYSHRSIRGYPGRALCSLISQPLLADESYDPKTRVSTMSRHIGMLCRRGFSYVVGKDLWDNMIGYWSAQINKYTGSALRIPRCVILAPPYDGGAGLSAPGYCCVSTGRTYADYPTPHIDRPELARTFPTKASADYAQHMATRFGPYGISAPETALVLKLSHESNIATAATIKDKANMQQTHFGAVIKWRKNIPKGRVATGPYGATTNTPRVVLAAPGSGKSFWIDQYGRNSGINIYDGDRLASEKLFNGKWYPAANLLGPNGRRDNVKVQKYIVMPTAHLICDYVLLHGATVLTAFASAEAVQIYIERNVPIVLVIIDQDRRLTQLTERKLPDDAFIIKAFRTTISPFLLDRPQFPSIDAAVFAPIGYVNPTYDRIAQRIMGPRVPDFLLSSGFQSVSDAMIRGIAACPSRCYSRLNALAAARDIHAVQLLLMETGGKFEDLEVVIGIVGEDLLLLLDDSSSYIGNGTDMLSQTLQAQCKSCILDCGLSALLSGLGLASARARMAEYSHVIIKSVINTKRAIHFSGG